VKLDMLYSDDDDDDDDEDYFAPVGICPGLLSVQLHR